MGDDEAPSLFAPPAALPVFFRRLEELREDPKNVRSHDGRNIASIKRSLQKHKQRKPLVVKDDGVTIIAGNGTFRAALELAKEDPSWTGLSVSPFPRDEGESEASYERRAREYAIADNRTAELAEWDTKPLYDQLMQLQEDGVDLANDLFFDDSDLLRMAPAEAGGPSKSLVEVFGAPPFSVLDSRQGYWRERKAEWKALGLQSELGREGGLLNMSAQTKLGYHKAGKEKVMTGKEAKEIWAGTSIFDPVLCELLIRWFSPPKGRILDPFAGGSVRGIVSSFLGREYHGVELRGEQVEANREQWTVISQETQGSLGLRPGPKPSWSQGDSAAVVPTLPAESFDFAYSCPPYAMLEKYSDDPSDLSNMTYEEFLKAYGRIIEATARALKPGRFCAWVIGEVRDPKTGMYLGFVPDTIRLFEAAGMSFYNEAILVTTAGSLPVRIGKIFQTRKLGKMHQNVLIFYKGSEFVLPPVEKFDLSQANIPDDDEDEE